MDGKRLLQTLRIQNFLSYGSDAESIQLEPLNVLIGANGSGKSNIIETIGLLNKTPHDLAQFLREGGGITEWLWKGAQSAAIAEIDTTLSASPASPNTVPLRYRLAFTVSGQRMEIADEAIENSLKEDTYDDVYFYYRYQQGRPALNVRTLLDAPEGVSIGRTKRLLRREDLIPDQSVLSQRKDPDQYPELTYVARQFSEIKFYRDWNFGRSTPMRKPQATDLPEDFLLEDASNLSLVLNNLEHHNGVKQQILEMLQRFYENVTDFTTRIQGGTVQLFFREKGLNQPIPATRLSDGTLRYLCLLAVLLHPTPPPLICIEEPELGMHPDIIATIAELLIDASQRTQLVVTTHSDTLVSALSSIPEAVMVCERDQHGSKLRRLEPEKLSWWLDKYRLGDIWRMGEIGGNRW